MAILNGDFLTVQQAADFLGLTDGRVRQIIRADELPATRVGQRSLLIPKKAVEKYKREKNTK